MSTERNNSKQYNVEITTSPEFIQMIGKKLYTNPLLAIVCRELLQNSRDATHYPNKGKINLVLKVDDNMHTSVVCDDTGCGMDEDTLVNTFLQIGGSKKAEGSVGGFGVAKVSLFATGNWSVHTRNNFVDASLKYEQRKTRRGTRIECQVTHTRSYNQLSELELAELFIRSCDVRNLWLNGNKVRAYKSKRILGMQSGAVVSTAPKLMGKQNKIFWRIHGLTQFISELGYGDDFGFNVIVDFDAIEYKPKDDNYPFGASRETVSDGYRSMVQAAVAPLAKNVLTARKEHGAEKIHRERIQHRAKQSKKSYIVVDAPKKIEGVDRMTLALWREICNAMKSYSHCEFGMTYDKDTNAEYRSELGHKYLLINPENWRKQWSIKSYSPKDSIPMIWSMWHLAVHEMTHAAGYSDHDENFTSAEGVVAHNTAIALSEKISHVIPFARKVLKGIVGLNNIEA